MTIFQYFLLTITAGAAIFSAWRLSSKKSKDGDDDKNQNQIEGLQSSLRDAQIEVATLQERLRTLENKKSEMAKEFKKDIEKTV